jgi:hypothetical protein
MSDVRPSRHGDLQSVSRRSRAHHAAAVRAVRSARSLARTPLCRMRGSAPRIRVGAGGARLRGSRACARRCLEGARPARSRCRRRRSDRRDRAPSRRGRALPCAWRSRPRASSRALVSRKSHARARSAMGASGARAVAPPAGHRAAATPVPRVAAQERRPSVRPCRGGSQAHVPRGRRLHDGFHGDGLCDRVAAHRRDSRRCGVSCARGAVVQSGYTRRGDANATSGHRPPRPRQ